MQMGMCPDENWCLLLYKKRIMNIQRQLEVFTRATIILKQKQKHELAVGQVFFPSRAGREATRLMPLGAEGPQALSVCLTMQALIFHTNPLPSSLLNYMLMQHSRLEPDKPSMVSFR